jgi:hypothetical protein
MPVMRGQRNAANTQLRLGVVVWFLKMPTTAYVPAFDISYELAMPRAQAWRGVLHWRRRSRSRPQDWGMSGCFGRLTAKDEMVAKGLTAGLTWSTEQGQH